MNLPCVLIDFENIQPKALGRLVPGATRIYVFLGQHQSKVMLDLVKALQSFGNDAEYIQIQGSGPDAVDFHIAFYVGEISTRAPDTHFQIISKDKGFDPLVKYLNRSGLKCRRINSMLEQDPGPTAAVNPQYKRVLEVLSKSEKKSLPRKRKTLAQHISSIFQKKLSDVEVESVIDLLFLNKQISEENGAITYSF